MLQWESLVGAIQLKDPTTFCNLLSQGVDLSPAFVCAGRPNVMLALAILRDDDCDDYLGPVCYWLILFSIIKPPFIEDVPIFFSVLGALRAGQVWWMAASRAASLPRLSRTS
jgi:hypothetical protein